MNILKGSLKSSDYFKLLILHSINHIKWYALSYVALPH